MLGRRRRLAILAEGCFNAEDAKTAVGVLRYRETEVAAVVDSMRAGHRTLECAGVRTDVPVVRDLAAAAALGADSLLLGIAPQGGGLPPSWRVPLNQALERGWDVLSGLHIFLADDPELTALAARTGARLLDVRRPPTERRVGTGAAAAVEALVVLTVGSDCNVGKMTTALELRRCLEQRGVRAAFVATGQTGIFIADHGVAVDAIPGDFAAGAIEALVVDAAREADVVLVEGQGALQHPGYSGVTLSLLHGAQPQALVLCHQPTRQRIRGSGRDSGPPIFDLPRLRDAYEAAAAWVRPARVVGLSLNTLGMDAEAARSACERAAATLGLPATDPVRFGAEPLAEMLIRSLEEKTR